MLVEGYYPLTFAIKNNYPLEELFVCPSLLRDKFNNTKLMETIKQKGVAITEVSESVFTKISSLESPEGLLAIAPKKLTYLNQHKPASNAFYLIVESIEKLSHLGEIFRLADNAGVSGVIVCNMRADMYNPEVVRSSLGTLFSVGIFQSTTKEAIDWCKKNNIQILATSPQASTNYTTVDMSKPTAIIIGTEYTGLTDEWLKNADITIKISMAGQANSLSVPSSTAVMLYEVVRQRRK